MPRFKSIKFYRVWASDIAKRPKEALFNLNPEISFLCHLYLLRDNQRLMKRHNEKLTLLNVHMPVLKFSIILHGGRRIFVPSYLTSTIKTLMGKRNLAGGLEFIIIF